MAHNLNSSQLEQDNDDLIDAWHDGYLGSDLVSPFENATLSAQWAEGRAQRNRDRRVRVVMPDRPEGYYHMSPDGE